MGGEGKSNGEKAKLKIEIPHAKAQSVKIMNLFNSAKCFEIL
jgi:hypothetical protein